MMRQRLLTRSRIVITFAICSSALGAQPVAAQTETIIHAFQANSAVDGALPMGGPVADGKGALYGSTASGGTYHAGSVYKLAPPAAPGGSWRQNILYSFTGGSDGADRLVALC